MVRVVVSFLQGSQCVELALTTCYETRNQAKIDLYMYNRGKIDESED